MTTLELIEVDPGTLIVGSNIRIAATLDKTFVDSIAEHGVKQPIQAYRDDVGALVVVAGQRRTLAATELGVPLVKVEIIDRPDDAGRIVDQVVENEHRTDMTNADRMRAFEQLALLGLPAAAIAKKTGHQRQIVDAGLAAAADKTAAAAVAEHDIDLVDAAAIAEFADDPAVMTELVSAAKHGNMTWLLQRSRENREYARKRAELTDTATAAGLTVLDKWPDTYSGPVALLSDLIVGGKKLTPAKHKNCPGHAGFIDQEWKSGKYELVTKLVCLNFKKHGHTPTAGRASRSGGRDSSAEGKAERRAVIQGNRDWKTATAIRLAWLREFLTGRAAPATASGFIALCLAVDSTVANAQNLSTNAMAQYLLGAADEPTASGYSGRDAFTKYVTKAGEKRALMIALGIVLGAHEAALIGHEWRGTYSSSKPAARYLRYLQLLGYELSPIELRACGETPADDDAQSVPACVDPEAANA